MLKEYEDPNFSVLFVGTGRCHQNDLYVGLAQNDMSHVFVNVSGTFVARFAVHFSLILPFCFLHLSKHRCATSMLLGVEKI